MFCVFADEKARHEGGLEVRGFAGVLESSTPLSGSAVIAVPVVMTPTVIMPTPVMAAAIVPAAIVAAAAVVATTIMVPATIVPATAIVPAAIIRVLHRLRRGRIDDAACLRKR
jgi:hypothetical protein